MQGTFLHPKDLTRHQELYGWEEKQPWETQIEKLRMGARETAQTVLNTVWHCMWVPEHCFEKLLGSKMEGASEHHLEWPENKQKKAYKVLER